MKKVIFIILITIVVTTGCRKDDSVEPTDKKSLPFENATLKLEAVATSYLSVNDIHFFNEAIGVVISSDGKIHKTNDKGKTWVLKYTNPTPDQPLLKILFVNQDTGYVVGGANWCSGNGCDSPDGLVLKTTDGGESWTNVYQVKGQFEFVGIAENSNGDLFLMQYGFIGPSNSQTKILRSNDGGINWISTDSFNHQLLDIAFSENFGFCFGRNGSAVIHRSNDNGNSWSNTTTFDELWISDISFSNNIGYCLADRVLVYRTLDNGDNWTKVYRTARGRVSKINALTANSCLLWGSGPHSGGDFGFWYGAVRQTTDAGDNWNENIFKDAGFGHTSFYSATEGYAMSGQLIKVTVK